MRLALLNLGARLRSLQPPAQVRIAGYHQKVLHSPGASSLALMSYH